MKSEATWWLAPQAWVAGAWAQEVLLGVDGDGRWMHVQAQCPAQAQAQATRLPGPVLPGVVNAHSHAFQRAIVGLTERRDPRAPSDDFWSWRDRMYAAANSITPEQLEAIATQLYGELLAGGYTQVCEFHYLHNALGGAPYGEMAEMSLALVRAARRTGIGLTLLPTLYMRAGFAQPELRQDQRRFAGTPERMARIVQDLQRHTAADAHINVGVAIHSLRAVPAAALKELAAFAAAQQLPVHIHIAEQTQEVDDCLVHTGMRPIEWLLHHVDVDARWNLVHATHTTRDELAGVQTRGASIVICPATEANLGDGVFDLPGYGALQGRWSIGSDSHVTRRWTEELRLLEYSQRLTQRKRNVAAQCLGGASSAAALLQGALRGGPSATGLALGGIAVGQRADFCVLDAQSSALLGLPAEHVLDACVFSSPDAGFASVYVAGRAVQPVAPERFVATLRELWGGWNFSPSYAIIGLGEATSSGSMASKPWQSLQLRVTLFTLGVFLLGVWSLSLVANRMLRDHMQAIVGAQQFSTVTALAAELNHQIEDRLQALQDVANGIDAATFARSDALQTRLQTLVALQRMFNAGVFITRQDGVPIADVPVSANRLGRGVAERDYMIAALQEGRASVGKPVLGKALGTPVFSMAAPIRDAQGKPVGAVVGVIDLSRPSFLEKVTSAGYGATGDYFVASLQHRINVTSSDKKRIMQSLPPVGANPHVDRFVSGFEGTDLYVDQRGIEIMVSVKGIPAAHWAMVATLPTAEAFAPIEGLQQRVQWATVLFSALAGVLIGWLVWRLVKRQLAPVLEATRALSAQADTGAPVTPLPVTSHDEYGELMTNFNRLLASLSQRSKALQESESYNKVLFAQSHIPLVVIDPEVPCMVDCNPAALEIYGVDSLQTLRTLSPLDVSTPTQYDGSDSLQAALGHIQLALRNRVHSFEWRHRRPNGEVWDGEVRLVAFEHAGKTLLQFSLEDITERKRTEADLRISATAFEMQEGMVITNANKQILRINAACSEITGYALEEVVGQTPRVFSSGRHDAAFYGQLWSSINTTGSWKGEIWNRRKNGEIYPQWAHISAVKGSGGVVTHYVASFVDISQRKSAEDEIRHLAFYDPLTRLPNRRLLLDRLRQAVIASARSESSVALLFIDLDKFKTLNDTMGHDKGDLLLESVAHRLTSCVREEDTVARLGGDEFVLMVEGLNRHGGDAADHARLVAQKVLDALADAHDLAGLAYTCTASIGVSLSGSDSDSVDELLKRADLAMYQAKAAGRNTMRFFDPLMQATVMSRAAMEADLRAGLQSSQLVLHYQPQVDATQRITGAEALVRWQHPRRGLVSPAEFIPLAEETGLILALGRTVLEVACLQLVAWAQDPATAHLTMAVNVSAHQFHQVDFVDQVLSVLSRTGARAQQLKLELTESLLVSNFDEVITKMQALRACGVCFSLDDFGTGYSSLAYLKRMPLEQLKIDQSFVRDVLTDANDAVIAKTIITLAQSLGLGVIAEGVETQAQREFLAQAGCHAYQGYYFSRPLPIADFAALLQDQNGARQVGSSPDADASG